MNKSKMAKIVRNLGIASFVVSPILGWLYVQSKMKNMEKGIYDDLERIKSKGKTLADIPRKIDWSLYLYSIINFNWLLPIFSVNASCNPIFKVVKLVRSILI